MLLKELDAIAFRFAGEALVAVVTRKYYEAAYVLIFVEWAQSEVSRPPLFKRNKRANHVHDVSRFNYAPNGKVVYFAHKPFYCWLIKFARLLYPKQARTLNVLRACARRPHAQVPFHPKYILLNIY